MINLKDNFFKKLILEGVGATQVNKHEGISLFPVVAKILPSKDIGDYNVELPDSLKDVYNQIELISILWSIYPMPEEGTEIPKVLKADSFLKESYWDEKYEWGVVHEYLRGFINLQKLEDILSPEFCKKQHFYSTIEMYVENENPEDYIPFDIHWDITACLKKENGKILDNIWLVSATNACTNYYRRFSNLWSWI